MLRTYSWLFTQESFLGWTQRTLWDASDWIWVGHPPCCTITLSPACEVGAKLPDLVEMRTTVCWVPRLGSLLWCNGKVTPVFPFSIFLYLHQCETFFFCWLVASYHTRGGFFSPTTVNCNSFLNRRLAKDFTRIQLGHTPSVGGIWLLFWGGERNSTVRCSHREEASDLSEFKYFGFK